MASALKARDEFDAALSTLVEQIQRDRSILAAILCGSLSHDTVWAKSDIDLVLVTMDDRNAHQQGLSLYADGINVHALFMPRAEFRKAAEGSLRNSFFHSFLAKGRLLYTHDESLTALCDGLHELGERDMQVQLMSAAAHALPYVYKAHKWLVTRGDLNYTALWILYAANALAKIEVLEHGLLVDREALPQAMKLNPRFFKRVYTDVLNAKKTKAVVEDALAVIDDYLLKRAAAVFAPILDHLEQAGEARSATEIEHYFHKTFNTDGVTGACEYLADQGFIGKVPLPVRLTKRSNVQVNELAFFSTRRQTDAVKR